jgi:HK97 family phage portal protein
MRNWIKAAWQSITQRATGSLSLVSNWLANLLWLMESTFLALAQQAYGRNPVVYACLRLLSQSVPEPPLKSYVEAEDGERNELPRSHPLPSLIRRPNELMSEYEMMELITLHLGIVGRSVWWKERDRAGRVVALWPLRPDRVGPIYSGSEVPVGERVLQGWSYGVPGTGAYAAIPRRDCLTFTFANPAGESGGIVEGIGPLQVLAAEVSADNQATEFVGSLVANYAAPTVALKVKASIPDEETARLIKERFRAEFGGARRGTPAVIDGDTDIQMLGFNLRELEFPELRSVAESRVAAAFGVPAILVGLKVGLESGIRATIAEQRRYFAETTLSNLWRRYQDQFTHELAVEFGENIVCEFDTSHVRALASHRIEQMQPVIDAFKAGALMVDDYRKALSLDPLPNGQGQVFLVPSNVTIKAKLEESAPPQMLPAPTDAPTLPPGKPDDEDSKEDDEQDDEEDPKPPAQLRREPEDDTQEEPPAKAIRAIELPADDAEEALRLALDGAFAKLNGHAADLIANGGLMGDPEIAEALTSAILPTITSAATNEVLRLGQEIGVQFDHAVVNAGAVAWAKGYTFDLVKGLTETTQTVLRGVISQFTATPGMTIGELRALVEPAFGPVRAQMIATTETTRAYAEATKQYQTRLKEHGVEMQRVWRTSGDEHTCPTCGPMNGKAEPEWGDTDAPPRHVNCRCRVTLAMPEEKK